MLIIKVLARAGMPKQRGSVYDSIPVNPRFCLAVKLIVGRYPTLPLSAFIVGFYLCDIALE